MRDVSDEEQQRQRKEELSRHFKQLEAIWAANDVYLGETDEQKT